MQQVAPRTLRTTGERVDRELLLEGTGFLGTSEGPWVYLGDRAAPGVRIIDGHTVKAYVPDDVHGITTVTLVNPDETRVSLEVALP